jgi:hypothetical protein
MVSERTTRHYHAVLGPQFSLSWKGKLGADLGVVFPVHY